MWNLQINNQKEMKKQTRKLSYDNLWALEQISKNQKLGSSDAALRFIIEFFNKITKIAQNQPEPQNQPTQTKPVTKNKGK